MKRVHAMPFGSAVQGEPAGVAFRLWAPSAREVALRLDGDGTGAALERPMAGPSEGWFETFAATAAPGSHYRFRIDGGPLVPDPASRFNPEDVHGPSEVIDAAAFAWKDAAWHGRPWHEAVLYELHVGCFTPAGTFAGVTARLDYLAELGVTAIELMPVADFPGRRSWGYDGVLPFAPDSRYGRPEDLKRLVQAAHERGLMVLLDVVYNHFGPEGNYLPTYAAAFFNPDHVTPWGPAINLDAPHSRPVRDFFIHNALYWLDEYHLDGLRLDAIHTIRDASSPNLVEELADAVRRGPGRERQIHLVLENERNEACYLARDARGAAIYAAAQWNDDLHHGLHVLLTGENGGHYVDYADRPLAHVGRCLAEGFSFQGQPSTFRHHARRGEPSGHLPPTAFVAFLQNHDQVGNRAFGERLGHLALPEALAAAVAVVLLAPSPPLLFMGEEFGAAQPFLYFCDFGRINPDLAAAVSEGRRREFAHFPGFATGPPGREIPDPNDDATFAASVLDWSVLHASPHAGWLALYRRLLALRREWITPRLAGIGGGGRFEIRGAGVLLVSWRLGDGSRLALLANLSLQGLAPGPPPPGRVIYRSPALGEEPPAFALLPPWSVAWFLAEGPP